MFPGKKNRREFHLIPESANTSWQSKFIIFKGCSWLIFETSLSTIASVSSVHSTSSNGESCCCSIAALFFLSYLGRFWAFERSVFCFRHFVTCSKFALACFALYRFFCSLFFFPDFLSSTSLLFLWISQHWKAWLSLSIDELNVFRSTIVNKAKWLGSPANIKGANKDAKKDLGWKVHDRAKPFVLRSYTMHELPNQHVSIG